MLEIQYDAFTWPHSHAFGYIHVRTLLGDFGIKKRPIHKRVVGRMEIIFEDIS